MFDAKIGILAISGCALRIFSRSGQTTKANCNGRKKDTLDALISS